MQLSTTRRIGGLALAAAMFAACGGGAATPAASTAAGSAPAESMAGGESPAGGGEVFVTGSSTVEPISSGVAEAFKAANADFLYTVEGPGTGDGFQKFCADEADIADASRPISEEEVALCEGAGIEYVELKVAIDGLSVLTSATNTAVTCLSFADLYALIGPESTGFANWTDAQALATELGSSTTFPDGDLVITGPGEESGTFDSFVELAFGDIAEARAQEETTRPDYTASPNDNAIIQGIADNPTSLGWVGFAFAEENRDTVTEIAVSAEPNGECVAPTEATISDGTYPLSRDLYIYVNTARAAANPSIGAFVDYYLTEGTISSVLETVPYVDLAPEALAETQAAWEAAK